MGVAAGVQSKAFEGGQSNGASCRVIRDDKDLIGQIYRQLKEAVRTGRLAAGEKLAASRLLAQQLGLSRKKVAEAYVKLTYDKLLVGRGGSSTFTAGHANRAAPPKGPSTRARVAGSASGTDES